MRNLLTIAILTIMAGTAQGSYTYILPMESTSSLNGALPDGSIRFINAGNGSGGDDGSTNPPVEKTQVEICNDNAEIAKKYITQNYTEVIYKSHMYGNYMNGSPPKLVDGCQIYYTISNGNQCTDNIEYSKSISATLRSLGFEVAAMACS